MKKLTADLKNRTFEKVYLLYGDEDYLRNYYFRKFREALASGDTMNVKFMDKDSVSVEEVRDFTDTMPFFADRRVLFLSDTGIFTASNDAYASWIQTLPDTACVIFNEKKADKRNKVFKCAAEAGYAVEFAPPTDEAFDQWVLRKLGSEGLKISRDAFNHLTQVLDHDMESALHELDKLAAYARGQETVTVQDIDSILTPHLESRIFDLVEAVARGNRKRSMDLYYEMLSLHEAPSRILYFIGRQFHQMLIAASMNEKRISNTEIAKALNIRDFIVRKLLDQSRRFSVEEMKLCLSRCVSLEEAFKSGDLTDTLAVELFIFEMTERKK
ncbi:MAG: DNA polymerase III subunit delta [Lachnospiraceae bacterium]|nr:DNA polymerase III subunit delta [Lachnospiraceae bacterium]